LFLNWGFNLLISEERQSICNIDIKHLVSNIPCEVIDASTLGPLPSNEITSIHNKLMVEYMSLDIYESVKLIRFKAKNNTKLWKYIKRSCKLPSLLFGPILNKIVHARNVLFYIIVSKKIRYRSIWFFYTLHYQNHLHAT
jgi:hypothetical protein